MSAAKMVADSTQGDSTTDGKKRKKKIKKSAISKNKVVLPEDEDSDLDLKKELHPIGFYLKDRSTMIEEMFHSVRGASLQRALPELLKSMPLEELKDLCLEQLEVMSKKRIQRILAGEESANISSSGTEDMDDEEEDVDSSEEDLPSAVSGVNSVGVLNNDMLKNGNLLEKKTDDDEKGPELTADSTSAVVNSFEHGQSKSQNSVAQQDIVTDKNTNNEQQPTVPTIVPEVFIKQEPPDSDPEQRGGERRYRSRRSSSSDSSRSSSRSTSRSRSRSRRRSRSSSSSGSSYGRRRRRRKGRKGRRHRSSSSSRSRSRNSRKSSEVDKASVIEGGYEDPPEAYTSGSEDGELVRKEVVPSVSVTVKQEVMSEAENDDGGGGGVDDNDSSGVKLKQQEVNEKSSETDGGASIPSVKEIEGDLLALASAAETNRDNDNQDKQNEDDDKGDEGGGGADDSCTDNNEDADAKGVEGAAAADDGDEKVEEGGSDDETGEGGGGAGGAEVGPSIMMDQMELLELEMRARAIKAMLMTSSQGEEGGDNKK